MSDPYTWPKPRGRPFKPSAHSFGPHARAAHDAGGHLSGHDLSRAKFNAMLKAYAPGCGSPVRVAGTNGGQARCGSTVGNEKVYCAHCGPTLESAAQIVSRLLEDELTDRDVERYVDEAPGEDDPVYEIHDGYEYYPVTRDGRITRQGSKEFSGDWKVKGMTFHHWSSQVQPWPELQRRMEQEGRLSGYLWDLDHGSTRKWGRKVYLYRVGPSWK